MGGTNVPELSPDKQGEAVRTHDDMITSRLLQHVRDELRRDRRAALVLLVLAGVWKEGHDGGDALRARDFAGVHHNAELHERRVDLATSRVDDVHVVLAHGFDDAHMALAYPALLHFGAAEWDSKPKEESRG
jgi:hypothetical protein